MALQAFGGVLNVVLLEELENIDFRNRLKIARRRIRDTSDPFQLPEKDFIKFFRLSKDLTRYLTNSLRPHLEVAVQRRRTAIPLELKILTALSFFGHGSYQSCVGNTFNLGISQPSVSQIITDVTNVIVEHLLDQWIVFPQTEANRNRIKQIFREKYNFPGIIGALDCTHVAIVAPPEDDPIHPALPYYNRKGYYSVNVQMICDADLKILNCNARYPGSVHDSAIWYMSAVKRHLLEKFTQGDLNSSWLIGDSGYGLQPWLLTPIENADPNTPEERYTRHHISARNTIERCFGVLKQRFRCLLKHRTLHYDPVKAGKIIYSCAILHNMALLQRLPLEDENPEEDPEIENPRPRRGRNENDVIDDNWLAQGRLVQQAIIRQHFNN